MTVRMPFTPRAQPGESPVSLLRRAAHGNGMRSTLRYAYSFNPKIDHSAYSLGTLARNPGLFRMTTEMMGIPERDVKEVIYRRTGVHGHDRLLWNGLQVRLGDLSFRHAKTCVICLKEAGYARSEWDHRAAVACTEHGVLLEAECPVCQAPWTNDEGAMSCGCPHDQVRRHLVPVDDLSASMLSRLIATKDQVGLSLLSSLCRVLDWGVMLGLRLPPIARAIALFDLKQGRWPTRASAPNDGPLLHPRIQLAPLLTDSLPDAQALAQQLLSQSAPLTTGLELHHRVSAGEAMAILGVQRVAFAKLVKDGRLTKAEQGYSVKDLNRLLTVTAGHQVEGLLPLAVYRTGTPPVSLSTLIGEIETGRITSFCCSPATGLEGLQAIRASPPQSIAVPTGWLTLAEVGKQLEVHPEYVRAVVRTGLLPATRGFAASPVQWLIQQKDLERFDTEFVFASALAKMLGASATTFVSRLRSAGLFPVSGPDLDGGLTYLFRRSHINAIDLQALISGPYKSPAGRRRRLAEPKVEMCTWSETARRLKLSSAQLHQAIADGWIRSIAHSVRVRKFEQAAVRSLEERLAKDFRSLTTAASQAGQSPHEFRRCWIESGVVTAKRFGNEYLIAVDELDQLDRQRDGLATAAEIGRLAGRHRTMCANLEKTGVLEVAASVGRGRRKVKLYSRSASVVGRLVSANLEIGPPT